MKLGTADRRPAIGRFLRAIPTSTCRRPFGATRRTRIPRRSLHQVVDLVLVKPSGVAQQQAVSENVTRLPAEALSKWAGMYRDPHTDQTITLSVANGSLSTGGRGGGAWMPLAADHFRAPLGDVTLSGAAGGRALRLIRADGDTVRYEEVRPATSPRLEDYAGTYTSDELDVVLTLAVKDGKLVMRRRPADEFELRPVYPDDFQAGARTRHRSVLREVRTAR